MANNGKIFAYSGPQMREHLRAFRTTDWAVAGMTERTCSVDGCNGRYLARGFCGKHYQRWKAGRDLDDGDAGAERRRQSLEGQPHGSSPDGTCVVPGCTKPVSVLAYGWCGMHHQRWLKTGSVQAHRPCRDDRRDDGWLWCSSCETHQAPDGFYRNGTTKTGRDGICKKCTQERWRQQREHRREVRRAYFERNRERVLAQKRASGRRNRARKTEIGRAWRKANPERVRLQIRAQNAARYARDKGAAGHCSPQQLAARWAYYGGKCWMCGAPATDSDHVKPLGAGGSNWPANLRPACHKCNRAKGAKWPFPLETYRGTRTARRQAA